MYNKILYLLGIPPKLPKPPEGYRLGVHGEFIDRLEEVMSYCDGWYKDWWLISYSYDQWRHWPVALLIKEGEKIPVPRKTRYHIKNRIKKLFGIAPELPESPENYRLAVHGEKIGIADKVLSYVDGQWLEDRWWKGDYNQWFHWPTAILVE